MHLIHIFNQTIVFTARGNFASAKISATLRYAAPLRHVAFTGLEATATEMGNASVLATVDEAEALLIAPPDGNGFGGVVMDAPSGSRVKLTLKIDPAKTDFDQTPVSREVTVV